MEIILRIIPKYDSWGNLLSFVKKPSKDVLTPEGFRQPKPKKKVKK